MLYNSNSVKFKHFTAAALILSTLCIMSGCKNVSEDVPVSDSIDTVSAEVGFDNVSSEITTSETTENTTETITEISENETEAALTELLTENTDPEETNRETGADTSPTVVSSDITLQQNTVAETYAETTAVTIQTESPSETIVQTTAVQTEQPAQISYSGGTNSYSALNYKEQKGIWISYLEYDSILKNKSESSFRSSIKEYFDNVKALSFNTVYVQVRAYGDAYYDSQLFPSGDRFSGTFGADVDFDPLQIMIEEAHSRGLSVHAWINPMRLMTDSQMKNVPDKYTIKKWYNDPDKNGRYVVKSGDRWYLNPAYSDVRQLIADGITEITANYDVDGIQIDDYFYPTTSASFDSSAYSNSDTELSLSDWRIKNVNSMVKTLCKAVHSANSTAVFGISPQGSIANNYNDLYADVKTWCSSSGYCDYILPQVYYGFDNAALPYENTITEWSNMTSSGNVKLVIGLAGYKIGAVDTYAGFDGKNEWVNNSDIISRQMASAKTLSNYGGVAIFRYGSIFTPSSDVSAQVSKELSNIEK